MQHLLFWWLLMLPVRLARFSLTLLLGGAGFALFVWTLQGVFGCQGHAAQQK